MGIEYRDVNEVGSSQITHYLFESWGGMATRDMDIHIKNLRLECDMCDKAGHEVILTFDTNWERNYGVNICKTCLDAAIDKEKEEYESENGPTPFIDQKASNAKVVQEFKKHCNDLHRIYSKDELEGAPTGSPHN